MKVTLNTEWCAQYHLNLEQALLLETKLNPISNNDYKLIIKLSRLNFDEIDQVDRVYNKIKLNSSDKNNEKARWAEEFFKTFPSHCDRPDGTRGSLRPNVIKRRFLVEYKKLIKTEAQHQRALEYMINDIEHRKRTNSMAYMKTIVNYILDAPWENEAEGKEKFTPYGGEFI